jgi:DNA-directed RNA polymerase beta' subunit
MPYVVYDENKTVLKVSARAIPGAAVLPHDHVDVIKFLESRNMSPTLITEAVNELRRTDTEMSRAVEDIITALLKKNILKMNDLPKAVQDRIAHRVKMRIQIQDTYDRASGS